MLTVRATMTFLDVTALINGLVLLLWRTTRRIAAGILLGVAATVAATALFLLLVMAPALA